jgi:asparagine synthase (glutamine-hydrolysing)
MDGVPSALYLSGGLGSTAIAASARTLHKELPSFTLGFQDDPHPELPFAGRVASLLGLEHEEIIVGSADLANAFDRLIPALGHPLGNPAALLQLLLAEHVGTKAKVVLTGDGSVELFGGRFLDGVARDLAVAKRLSHIPGPLRRTLTWLPGGGDKRRLTTDPSRYGLDLGLGGSNLFSTAERERLLVDPAWVRPDVRHDVLAPFYADLDTDPLNAVLNATLRSWLCEDALTRADRTGARAGLDTRFPLLDRDLLTLAASLPGSFKVRRVGGSVHTRWPLRAMLKGVLPPPLVNRPKRWMPAPMDAWLRGPGRLFLEDRVNRLRENRRGLWKVEAIDALKTGLARGDSDGLKLWGLILLDAWMEQLDD